MRLAIVAFFAVIALATTAAAQPAAGHRQSHLALAQPAAPESLPASAVRQIVIRIAEGLVETGLDVSVDPFPAGACGDAGCLRDMARAHGAAAIVMTRITAEGQNYRIRIDLVDGATGHPVDDVESPCNFCAYDELGSTALQAIRTLLHRQQARQGQTAAPLRLVRRTPPIDARRRAWGAVGLGAAAVATGALVMAVEGDGQGRWPALLTVAAGALLAGSGGVVLLFWPEPTGRSRFVMGAGAAVRGSF